MLPLVLGGVLLSNWCQSVVGKNMAVLVGLLGVSIVVFCLVWGALVEPSRTVITKRQIALPNWKSAHGGLRIALISDLHIGSPHNHVGRLRELVAQANSERPDMIFLLGDYVIHDVFGGEFVAPSHFAPELARLEAPFGVYAVLGNHDCSYDEESVAKALEHVGIPVLQNESIRLDVGDEPLWISGVRDLSSRRTNLDRAISHIPKDESALLLTHNPAVFSQVPAAVNFSVAGHTHGGQVRVPWVKNFLHWFRGSQPYTRGYHIREGKHFFVTSGVGTSVVPVRFRVPPEIAVLTLITESEHLVGRDSSKEPRPTGGQT